MNLPDQGSGKHTFDLEKRTTVFAKQVIRLCKLLSVNPVNNRLITQAVSSAGSIGANYREANDVLGKKDFLFRLRIARKEAKESLHWLELLQEANQEHTKMIQVLLQENKELKYILSSIIAKNE